jgi:hypothetical protein
MKSFSLQLMETKVAQGMLIRQALDVTVKATATKLGIMSKVDTARYADRLLAEYQSFNCNHNWTR